MCNAHHSESGQLCSIQGCAEYLKLKSERDHLQGVVQGMTEQTERNVKALVDAEQRLLESREVIETLDDAIHELIKDREYFEQREKAAVQERDRLTAIVVKADALVLCTEFLDLLEGARLRTPGDDNPVRETLKGYQEARHG